MISVVTIDYGYYLLSFTIYYLYYIIVLIFVCLGARLSRSRTVASVVATNPSVPFAFRRGLFDGMVSL